MPRVLMRVCPTITNIRRTAGKREKGNPRPGKKKATLFLSLSLSLYLSLRFCLGLKRKMEDPYGSILEVCNCNPIILSVDHNRNIVPFIPHDNGRFIDHSLDSDGTFISPESLADYLCPIPTPETLRHDPTPCVQCCQILSPPHFESPLGSREDIGFDHQPEIHPFDLNDASYTEPNLCDDGDGEALWLSQLKSMARLEGFFDDAISIVTRFRFSRYKLSMLPSLFNSKKKPFGSSRKSRKMLRPSISGKLSRTTKRLKM